ncbi:hypothetical protein NW069_01320 [Mycoplasmopsis cynos]|nr:hypothetical protein [Mycoplasmopsis cynos]MCU9933535.1 hypothetical protein [Mycoplasmopsis cynos]UWV77188.1 hypothetical protein NW070_05605 [Mycoplasmopsis cynos]UWV80810.1 hypothetical protein NW069_01320 [Mycoplasmopsis cynos]
MIHKKYKIGRVLGYGGMGVVCSVRLKDDPSTEYALKYRYNDFNELSKKRFLDEIKLLKKLNLKIFQNYLIHIVMLKNNSMLWN